MDFLPVFAIIILSICTTLNSLNFTVLSSPSNLSFLNSTLTDIQRHWCISSYGSSCIDDICYGTTFIHQEGPVHRFGCLSDLGVARSLNCHHALRVSNTTVLCVDSGMFRICCCDATYLDGCNSQWKPAVELPKLKGTELGILLCAFILMIIVFLLVFRLHKYCTLYYGTEVSDYCAERLMKIEIECGVAKILSFKTGVIFSVYPILLMLLDINRLLTMTVENRPCRPVHAIISLLIATLAGGITSTAVFEAIQLYHLEAQTSYCRVGRHIWHIGSAFVLYYVYLLMAVVHEAFVTLYQCVYREFNAEEQNSIQQRVAEENIMSTLETARSNTTVKQDDFLYIYPKPFILDESGESVLNLQNIHVFEWIALRVLVSAPHSYYIYPQKVIIPPQRSATISVRLRGYFDLIREDVGLMLQWFPVGRQCPSIDVTRFWLRPHFKPRSQWKFYVLPIYHEPKISATEDL